MRYQVQWNYRTNQYAFQAGQVVDLEEQEAAQINNDSPGVLVALAAPASPPADKMVRAAGRK